MNENLDPHLVLMAAEEGAKQMVEMQAVIDSLQAEVENLQARNDMFAQTIGIVRELIPVIVDRITDHLAWLEEKM